MSSSARLLDDEGNISAQLEICLKHIFSKYCYPPVQRLNELEEPESSVFKFLSPCADAYLTTEGLDKWAYETNGCPFTKETKDELIEFLDVTDDGNLTFKGFLQVYQLQTENDEEETWRDLSKHGFDRTLKFVMSGELGKGKTS